MNATFSIHCKNERFSLVEHGSLPKPHVAYLQDYLVRLNRRPLLGYYKGAPVFSLYQAPLCSPAGIRSMEMRLKRRFAGARIPATATLGITKACQCRCEHCSAMHYNFSQKPELTTTEWRQAIQEAVGLGVTQVIFLGGEPLLRPDLPELVAAVPSAKAITALFTNGEFLTKSKCSDLAQAGLMGIFVSIDSPVPEEHDRLRHRTGLFAKALAGLACAKSMGLLTALSSYLSPERLAHGIFEDMMELGKDIGVHEITFFDAIPSGRWLDHPSCLLGSAHRQQIRHLVRRYREKKGYPVITAQSLLTSKTGTAFCFAANTQFYLTAHGEMCPCDFTPLTVGKFPDKSLTSLWKTMISTPPYQCRAKSCRMQDPEFHRRFLQKSDSRPGWPRQLLEIKS